jgi:hypothetical protein
MRQIKKTESTSTELLHVVRVLRSAASGCGWHPRRSSGDNSRAPPRAILFTLFTMLCVVNSPPRSAGPFGSTDLLRPPSCPSRLGG